MKSKIKFWKSFIQRVENLPQYKVIKYQKGNENLYLLQHRVGFYSWEYIMSNVTIGADVCQYRMFFKSKEEAVNFIEAKIKEKNDKRITTEIISTI